jgi:hypothetical protein
MKTTDIEEKLQRLGFRKSVTISGQPIWVNPVSGASVSICAENAEIGAENLLRLLDRLQVSWAEFDAT